MKIGEKLPYLQLKRPYHLNSKNFNHSRCKRLFCILILLFPDRFFVGNKLLSQLSIATQ